MPAGPLQANCHFIHDPEVGGVIIDPGGDAPELMVMIEMAEVELKAILLTHGHSDHVGATAEIAAATGARIFGSEEAREVLAAPDEHQIFPGMPSFLPATVDQVVTDDQDIDLGGMTVRAIMTPGHTPGSITWFAEPGLFCGDLLFRGSVGRTDLLGGSFEELAASVHKLMLQYPPDTVVYPGHGSSTTLGREQETNPFLSDLGW